MTDPFATSRNGHVLTDQYDAENNTLDIRYKGLYPANVLSNLYDNAFVFDGVRCGSMEGFLQSLKYPDEQQQREICALHGGSAKDKSTAQWQQTQTLWWKGVPYQRESEEYMSLICSAYKTMSEHNGTFRDALISTSGIELIHTLGESDPTKTILTDNEFCMILTALRNYLVKDFRRRSIRLYICCLFLLVPAIACFKIASEGNPVNQTGSFVSGLFFSLISILPAAYMLHKRLKYKRLGRQIRHQSE